MSYEPAISIHPAKRIEYDGTDNELYIGYAHAGALETDEVWTIQMNEYSGTNKITSITFADGTTLFDRKWSDRAIYIYS